MSKKPTSKKRPSRRPSDAEIKLHNQEKPLDEVDIEFEISENYRETDHELGIGGQKDTSVNWSQAEDRSEDLINERDPFIQQPEKDTQIPPELIQERAYHLYEQRGNKPGDNLADWFEAERQLRGEIAAKRK